MPTVTALASKNVGLTCMQLAVYRNATLFDWILERTRQVQWVYGNVTLSLIPLEEPHPHSPSRPVRPTRGAI